ncbi:MAG: MCE family protein [Bryobacteraceae bacterium]|jgi:phospholipid/cholesterol/gamma-HCH transport system substrate-binding protein
MAELEIKPTAKMRLRVAGLIWIAIGISAVEMYLLAGSDLFARRTTLTTYLPDAAGVTTDSEVRLSGIRIGGVRKVELSGSLDPRRIVRVEMRILARYLKFIPSDSQTDINADTVVDIKFIDIAEGKSPLPIAEDAVLQSKPAVQATDRTALLAAVQRDLAQVDQILAQMLSPNTEVGRFVNGEAEYDAVLSRVSGFDSALHTFLNPQGKLGKAVFSMDMYADIHDSVLRVDKTLASIQNGEGTAGRLFASDDQYNQFLRQLADLRASLAAANASSLLQDDASYVRIVRLLAATDAMMASLNTGEGRAGRLLANPQLYESLNGSLRSMETLLRDFREHPRKYLRIKLF